MTVLLQNHPGEREFPVKASFRYYKDGLRNQRGSGLTGLLLPVMLISGGLLFALLKEAAEKKAGTGDHIQLLTITGAVFLLSTLLMAWFLYKVMNGPKTEQQRYYRLAGLSVLPEEKRQALRLELVQMHYYGFWPETLEYYPLRSRLGNAWQQFRFLSPAHADEYRRQLDEDWGVISRIEFEALAEKLLLQGWHCFDFTMRLNLEDPERQIRTRLCNLTGLSPDYVAACLKPGAGDRPPKLIWAFDWWRLIVMTRNAFMAGYVTEERAWEILLQVAAYSYELYENYQDFYDNYRLGHAYWSNTFESTQQRKAMMEHYQTYCRWPMRDLPWPARKHIALPEVVETGFADKLWQVKVERKQQGLN